MCAQRRPSSKMGHRIVNHSKSQGDSVVKIFIPQSKTKSSVGFTYNFFFISARFLHDNELAENSIATDTFEDLVSLKKL